jgi:hypothetical protein
MSTTIEARALEIANGDYAAGLTFGVSRDRAMPILLRAARSQAEREAATAGLPASISRELADAEDAHLAAQMVADLAKWERLNAATRARLTRAETAARDWRAAHSLEAAASAKMGG